MRRFGWVLGSASLLAAAAGVLAISCGESTKPHASSTTGHSGSFGGNAAGGDGLDAAGRGQGGTPADMGGSATDSAGGASAAGAPNAGESGADANGIDSASGYSLTYILLPPVDVAPDKLLGINMLVQDGSADGHALVGTADVSIAASNPNDAYVQRATPFYFTLTGGLQVIEMPLPPAQLCISESGRNVLATPDLAPEASIPPEPGLFTWAPGVAAKGVRLPDGYSQGLLQCSRDASSAVVDATNKATRPLFWQQSQGSFSEVVPHPGVAALALSRDGTHGLLNASGPTLDADETYFWTAPNTLQDLNLPAGERCSAFLINAADGTTIAGYCLNEPDGTGHAFRWTQAGGLTLLEPNTIASALSADGSTLFGAKWLSVAAGHLALAVWHGRDELKVVDWVPPSNQKDTVWEIAGTANDGSAAYMTVGALQENDYHSARWTEQTGIVFLPAVGADDRTWVSGISTDGSLAVGFAGKQGVGPGLLWDAQGARDIGAELLGAGVDLDGSTVLIPERVWRLQSRVRIQGRTVFGGDNRMQRAFIAELPLR